MPACAARGEIGDGDPLQALEDALRSFSADAIIISTHPAGSSNWLEQGVVEAARARFDVPVTHVVGDASASTRAAARASGSDRAAAAGPAARCRGYLPETLETYAATSAIWVAVSVSENGGHGALTVRDAVGHELCARLACRRGSGRSCRSSPRRRACGSRRSCR